MQRVAVSPRGPLRGRLEVPGDKSVSHRALLLNFLAARGKARIRRLLDAEDVHSTLAAVSALGAHLEREGRDWVLTPGTRREAGDVIDCGNSGTTTRLLCGVLAGSPGLAVLTGDASLRRRPMGRVVQPLRAMGAVIDGRQDGDRVPLAIRGRLGLDDVRHDLRVSSAQVKSCLLLAAQASGSAVTVREPRQSRDHSERMLRAMGARLSEDDGALRLVSAPLQAVDVDVPADLSAAAFWLVAGSIVPGSEIELVGVGLNPTRAGIVDALRAMGADIEVANERGTVEPIADLRVRHAGLRGILVEGDLALRCLDELPVLAVAAAFAEGTTRVADASELRVKESDRIARTTAGLRALGVSVEERPDGMVIEGGRPAGPARVDATGDHRIAMAFAVAGLVAEDGVTLEGAESVRSSYPAFFEHLEGLCAS